MYTFTLVRCVVFWGGHVTIWPRRLMASVHLGFGKVILVATWPDGNSSACVCKNVSKKIPDMQSFHPMTQNPI